MDEDPNAELKERTSRLWGLGDYSRIANMIRPASRSLVDACAISAGQEILDVAAGTGNLALLAAEEGADVTACDLSPRQVELGRERTAAEGVDVEWLVADVEALPFEDGRFDCVASVFGAMFAPRPELAASEMFRVTRSGGTVGLSSWGDYGVQGEVFETFARFEPPRDERLPFPRDWGDERVAEERLAPLASSLQLERRTIALEYDSFDALWDVYLAAGPGAAARNAMPQETVDEVREAIRAVVDRHNRGQGGRVVLEAEYLEMVARKRG